MILLAMKSRTKCRCAEGTILGGKQEPVDHRIAQKKSIIPELVLLKEMSVHQEKIPELSVHFATFLAL